MKFTISWWDSLDGVGIATSESGVECLLHRSNLSNQQCKSFQSGMVIYAEVNEISNGIYIIERPRTASKQSASKNPKKLSREIAI